MNYKQHSHIGPFALGLVFAATTYAIGAVVRYRLMVVTVKGSSMAPTLHHGDRVLALRTRRFRRGSIVVGKLAYLQPDEFTDDDGYFVKRVRGLGGDTVQTDMDSLPKEMRDALLLRASVSTSMVTYKQAVAFGSCYLRGDNPLSTDSLLLGGIPTAGLVAVVVQGIRLAPSCSPEGN